MAAAVLRLGRVPGVDRPALAIQMVTETGPLVLLDIGANPDSTPENLAQYAHMGALFAERALGVERAPGRAPLDRRGEGQGRRADPAGHGAARRVGPQLRRQRRGQGPRPPPGRRRRLRRGAGQRHDQVLRGPRHLHLRPLGARSSGASLRGRLAYLLMRPGDRPDPADLRLRGARRLAAPRRARHGDHHPRPGQAADGQARDRRRGGGGPGPPAGADRGDLPARGGPAALARTQPAPAPTGPGAETPA